MKRHAILPSRIRQGFLAGTAALVLVHAAGTVGYRLLSPQSTWIDCFYMTFITIATIGYTEVVDLGASPTGRLFTIAIAFVGIGALTYLLSTLTAFILEGDLNFALRRRRMEKQIGNLNGHYILCGIGRVGSNVAEELAATGRAYVVVDENMQQIERHLERYPDDLYVHGDASDDTVLEKAGIRDAIGVFAITGEDVKNIVISLTARQLRGDIRIVARVHEVRNADKTRRTGADVIVSPDFTGGLRIASAMIRPQVVSFLDEMLKSEERLRVEEITVGSRFEARPLESIDLESRDYLLLAIREGDRWVFHPDPSRPVHPGSVLVFMATPHARHALEVMFQPA